MRRQQRCDTGFLALTKQARRESDRRGRSQCWGDEPNLSHNSRLKVARAESVMGLGNFVTNVEFEGIVEEAWQRHLDSPDRSDAKFWFWVAEVAWERGYAASGATLMLKTDSTDEANDNSRVSHPSWETWRSSNCPCGCSRLWPSWSFRSAVHELQCRWLPASGRTPDVRSWATCGPADVSVRCRRLTLRWGNRPAFFWIAEDLGCCASG